MCLPDFQEFKQVLKKDAITGYRNWLLPIRETGGHITLLRSVNQSFIYDKRNGCGRHKVTEDNSGIYAYNYNNYHNNNYNNYYYDNNNNYYYHNNNNYYYYYYYVAGIIKQYGKVAIHLTGQRSEYAIIDTLFTIRKSDAIGPPDFLNWIDIFNSRIEKLADYYNCKTINYQDFK